MSNHDNSFPVGSQPSNLQPWTQLSTAALSRQIHLASSRVDGYALGRAFYDIMMMKTYKLPWPSS